MNIEQMEAGRELDAIIAEKVMGYKWEWCNGRTSDNDYWKRWYDDKGNQVMCSGVTKFSTNIEDAWKVVEMFLELQYPFFNIRTSGATGNKFIASLGGGSPELYEYTAVADTAPLAICKAALLYVESGGK